jgi:hypothetical protein
MPIPPQQPNPPTQKPATVAVRTRRFVNQPPEPVAGPGAATKGKPVNPLSRAVNPKEQYPLHFDLLMRDLYKQGMVPEQWKVIAADEVRLDENGMDVEFTLHEPKVNRVWRRRVEVQHGKLLRIVDG